MSLCNPQITQGHSHGTESTKGSPQSPVNPHIPRSRNAEMLFLPSFSRWWILLLVALIPTQSKLNMGGDWHLRVFVWGELLRQQKKTFLAGGTALSFLKICTGRWRHPGEHKPNRANSTGHVSCTPQTSQLRQIIPRDIIPRNYKYVLPGFQAPLSIPSSSYGWSSSSRLFTLGWFSPPREKDFFFLPRLFESFTRELQHL